MARKFRKPVSAEHAEALMPGIYRRLVAARDELAAAVAAANEHLDASPITDMVAQALGRSMGKRRQLLIRVADTGEVFLVGEESDLADTPLPPLDDLREQAEQIGIPTEEFGRSKKKLLEAMESPPAAVERPPTPAPRKIQVATEEEDISSVLDQVFAPAAHRVAAPSLPAEDEAPPAPRPRPPRHGVPALGSTQRSPGKSLAAIIQSADEVDVDKIGKPPA